MKSPQQKHHKQAVPPGFRANPKPKFNVVTLTVRELQDHYQRNANILSTTSLNSHASFIPRLQAEQAAIEKRMQELGVNALTDDLQVMSVSGNVVSDAAAVRTKRRIVATFNQICDPTPSTSATAAISLEQAMDLERKAQIEETERQQKELEKHIHRLPRPYEHLTRAEREARIWAFMNHKPTDSDMEDDDWDEGDDDDDDNNPVHWFEDDQDDGRKGQNLVDPDIPDEDLSHIIRIDESRIDYRFFPSSDS